MPLINPDLTKADAAKAAVFDADAVDAKFHDASAATRNVKRG